MAKLTGRGLATFAKSKVGTPYVYGAKGADGKLVRLECVVVMVKVLKLWVLIMVVK